MNLSHEVSGTAEDGRQEKKNLKKNKKNFVNNYMIPAQTESLLNQIRRMVEERHPDVQVCCFKIVLVNLVFWY